jgi:hypothetical protein
MKTLHDRSAMPLVVTALAGLAAPWMFAWLLGCLGSLEALLAEHLVANFARARAGVHSFYTLVVPFIDALVCAVAFGIPLGFIGGRLFFRTWLIFMISVIGAQLAASLVASDHLGGLGAEILMIVYEPFWWLFALGLLGTLALVARSKRRVTYAA